MSIIEKTLNDLSGDKQLLDKVELAKNLFIKKYQKQPDFFARAPGRINLIGEHIDYMGYGVFPFALEQDCIIAVSVEKNQDKINLCHMDEKEYPSCQIPVDCQAKFNFINNYVQYFWCGYRAAVHNQVENCVGMNILITGFLPVASGLSSSASLVVCAGILALKANNWNNKQDSMNFIERLIQYERETGTACGGMDQSIIMLGKKNSAYLIEFNPLKGTPYKLPDNITFVVCQSLVKSEKLTDAPKCYNMRVCECKIAIEYLRKKFNLGSCETLLQIQNQLNKTFDEMTQIVKENIPLGELSRQQIEKDLEVGLDQYLKMVPLYEKVLEVNSVFKPFQRAIHVFSEAQRVIQFSQICQNEQIDKNDKAVKLGQLMNESQLSCDLNYECSHPQLNQLIQLGIQNGSLGSRLTGAGWGGCTISMVRKGEENKFIDILFQKFYTKEMMGQLTKEQVIFATDPFDGAFLINFK